MYKTIAVFLIMMSSYAHGMFIRMHSAVTEVPYVYLHFGSLLAEENKEALAIAGLKREVIYPVKVKSKNNKLKLCGFSFRLNANKEFIYVKCAKYVDHVDKFTFTIVAADKVIRARKEYKQLTLAKGLYTRSQLEMKSASKKKSVNDLQVPESNVSSKSTMPHVSSDRKEIGDVDLMMGQAGIKKRSYHKK